MNTKYITLVLLSCLYCVGAHAAGRPQSQSYYQIYANAETPKVGYDIEEDHEADGCKRTTIDWYEITDFGSTYDQTLVDGVLEGVLEWKVITEELLKETPLYRCNIDNGLTDLPSCDDGDVVALTDGKWRCDDGVVYDSWERVGDIPECKHQNGSGDPDPYLIFKEVENAVPYLRDFGHSFDTLYTYSVAKPSEYLCKTYACKEGYSPNIDVHNDRSNNAPQCVGGHDACPLYKEGGAKPSEYSRLNTIATEDYCNSTWYRIPGSSDQYYGKQYIAALKEYMQTSLQDNADLAQQVFVMDPQNGTFTCDNSGCTLKGDVFNSQQCDFLCAEDGFKVRLHHKKTSGGAGIDPCPEYFKESTSGDGTNTTYTCVFDTDAAQDALDQKQAADVAAATATMNACATAICEASDGEYLGGECMCGDDVCTTKFGDTSYKYCGGEQRGPFIHFCGDTGLAPGVPEGHTCYKNNNATECYKELVQTAYNTTQACTTAASSAVTGNDSVADDANNTENISELAKTLDAIENAYGLSKWRTVDGKFNYARLASDATAAVVLGTTGALVTSSVVKKKQVEAGFESLECTVGGQHVGDWGDVFRIDGK